MFTGIRPGDCILSTYESTYARAHPQAGRQAGRQVGRLAIIYKFKTGTELKRCRYKNVCFKLMHPT